MCEAYREAVRVSSLSVALDSGGMELHGEEESVHLIGLEQGP